MTGFQSSFIYSTLYRGATRAMDLAQNGDFDGMFVWFYEAEREKWFYFSDPLVDVRFVFFHLKSYSFAAIRV